MSEQKQEVKSTPGEGSEKKQTRGKYKKKIEELEAKVKELETKINRAEVKEEGNKTVVRYNSIRPVLDQVWKHIQECPECRAEFIEFEKDIWGDVTKWLAEKKQIKRKRL